MVPNFVDIPPASESAPPQQPPGGEPASILFVGPAEPHKGRQVLLEAFRGLRGKGLALRLAGGDGTLTEPGISDLGRRDEAELAGLYRDALFLVVPSVWPDPCPTVALEAMAHGTPVIASATGGLTDIVEHGVSGLLVEPRSSAALLNAMESMVEDGELRLRLGRGALRAVERFSSDVVLPELEEIYAELANPAGSRPDASRGPVAGEGLRRGAAAGTLSPGRARGPRHGLRGPRGGALARGPAHSRTST